jgi:hypothetical protein
MSTLRAVCAELLGLFVDDEALALGIVVVVALAGALTVLMPEPSLPAGAVLLFGCLGVLVATAIRTAQRR